MHLRSTKKIRSSIKYPKLTMASDDESNCFDATGMLAAAYFMLYLTNELSIEERRQWDRRTPRHALRNYGHSAFRYLYQSGNNQALLNCCGTTHVVFRELLALFEPYFNMYTFDDDCHIRKVTFTRSGVPKGRRRDLDSIGCFGLVLYWYRTKGLVARAIAMAFGVTSTPKYHYLCAVLQITLTQIGALGTQL